MQACCNDWHWYLTGTNEEGWRCCGCGKKPGEPPGFCPELDRALIHRKVFGILHDLHDSNVVYLSNSSMGEAIEACVAARCVEELRFDQYSIVLFILESLTPSHAKYWADLSEAIVAGNDSRRRCYCGQLATSSSGAKYSCSAHATELFSDTIFTGLEP